MAEGRVVLQGIDQARSVEVGPDYLARTNSHSDAPALQHAYAITTYSAQGTTVDRAYVAADPSMDKQELYVAASRSREETWIYATPEIQVAGRAEIAPAEPQERGGLAHIGDAAVRDRAQRAAHDVAKLEALPGADLAARQRELQPLTRAEREGEGHHDELSKQIERDANFLAGMDRQREGAARLPRKMRRRELTRIEETEARIEGRLARMRAEAAALPAPTDAARRELAAVEAVLAQRERMALTAARLATPAYLTAELGERPGDKTQARLWDRGASVIELYRAENGIKDRSSAFGPGPASKGAQERRRLEMQRAQRLQQELRQAQELQQGRRRNAERGMELGL